MAPIKRQQIFVSHACSNYIFSSPRWLCARLMFHQQHYYSSYLLCCCIRHRSTGWCCGTLLYCEEEIQLSEVLFSNNSSQAAAAATASTSTSVWRHCWPVSEHWTEGECCVWPCAAVMTISDYSSYAETLFSIIGLVSVYQCHALVCGQHSRNWLLQSKFATDIWMAWYFSIKYKNFHMQAMQS